MLLPEPNETLEQFFERCFLNYARRPPLTGVLKKRFKVYLEDRKRKYWERIAEKFANDPNAGTREGKVERVPVFKRDANGNIIGETFRRRYPGSRGGVSSTIRSKKARANYLREAHDDTNNGQCQVCWRVIKHDKAKVLCVHPKRYGRKYEAVICKSCAQGENIRMHTRAGDEVWEWLQMFTDKHVRAWIRWKLATVSDELLLEFRKYVLGIDYAVRPKRE